ncbi:hypothetical protein CEXT_701021 [Caerostris extrusa]|uniref:Uncharacterized protein n=1 Tax=Caerostris extrusa TaxID=172846 RepID=A0AAV4VHA3_CAEEX|nr:hypothetical protein CEXT_701021 [Caerostris extrusa]
MVARLRQFSRGGRPHSCSALLLLVEETAPIMILDTLCWTESILEDWGLGFQIGAAYSSRGSNDGAECVFYSFSIKSPIIAVHFSNLPPTSIDSIYVPLKSPQMASLLIYPLYSPFTKSSILYGNYNAHPYPRTGAIWLKRKTVKERFSMSPHSKHLMNRAQSLAAEKKSKTFNQTTWTTELSARNMLRMHRFWDTAEPRFKRNALLFLP